jgi:hypothetical protein
MIKQKLDEYLEFDSNYLFKSYPNNYVSFERLIRVFGGALRDIIANQPIHDVDILCGSMSLNFLRNSLQYMGFTYMDNLVGKDIASLYKGIRVISEPHTWIKGTKIVQLIRPTGFNGNTKDHYKKNFTDLISNVDISCCGLSYDGETLFENFPNAIIHCQNKVFSVNNKAKMYSDRIHHRRAKLEERGWSEISDSIIDARNIKIENLMRNNQPIDFIPEFSSDLDLFPKLIR